VRNDLVQCDGGLHARDSDFHGLLHFLKSVHFDLPHTFPGNAEFGSQLIESDWLITESACLEDEPGGDSRS